MLHFRNMLLLLKDIKTIHTTYVVVFAVSKIPCLVKTFFRHIRYCICGYVCSFKNTMSIPRHIDKLAMVTITVYVNIIVYMYLYIDASAQVFSAI